MELVPETLYSNELTRLCARENYTESCRRESFKTYNIFLLSCQPCRALSRDLFPSPIINKHHHCSLEGSTKPSLICFRTSTQCYVISQKSTDLNSKVISFILSNYNCVYIFSLSHVLHTSQISTPPPSPSDHH
jgi:hypothetical protein